MFSAPLRKRHSSSSSGGGLLDNAKNLFTASSRNEAWMRTAGEMGLSYIRPKSPGGTPEIFGHTDRMDVSVSCAPPENGYAPETVCRIKLPSSQKMGLLIMKDYPEEIRRNFSGRRQYNSLIGFSQTAGIETAVSAYEEGPLNEYLTPERAQFISDCTEEFQRFKIDDESLVVRFSGIERDADRFISRLEKILSLAKNLIPVPEERKAASVILTQTPVDPLPHIDDFELKKKLSRREEEPVVPAPVPIPATEKNPESILKTPPKPEIREEAGPRTVQPSPEPEAGPTTEPDAMPSKEQLIPSLWTSSSVGQKEKELFEKYKGRRVQWDGILKSAYDFSTDFVFGSGGGIKATLEVYELTPGNSLLRAKIKAVVHFSKEDSAVLKSASGKKVVFQGELLKIEPFAKELYLSSGKVIRVE